VLITQINYINNYEKNNNCPTLNDNNESTWIYESGEFVHFTYNKSLLEKFKKYKINLTCATILKWNLKDFACTKALLTVIILP